MPNPPLEHSADQCVLTHSSPSCLAFLPGYLQSQHKKVNVTHNLCQTVSLGSGGELFTHTEVSVSPSQGFVPGPAVEGKPGGQHRPGS